MSLRDSPGAEHGAAGRLHLWVGIECTIAHVGDAYRDQVGLIGHHDRVANLDLVAGLGVRTLRYPVRPTYGSSPPDKVARQAVP